MVATPRKFWSDCRFHLVFSRRSHLTLEHEVDRLIHLEGKVRVERRRLVKFSHIENIYHLDATIPDPFHRRLRLFLQQYYHAAQGQPPGHCRIDTYRRFSLRLQRRCLSELSQQVRCSGCRPWTWAPSKQRGCRADCKAMGSTGGKSASCSWDLPRIPESCSSPWRIC